MTVFFSSPNPNLFRFPSQGEQHVSKRIKFDCGFCGGQQGPAGHVIRSCWAFKSFGVRVQSTDGMRAVLASAHFPRDVDALAAITALEPIPGGDFSVQLLAIAAPVPTPDVLGAVVRCKVATFNSWNLSRGPVRTVVTTWGDVLEWCNHFKSKKHFLFAKCA